MTITLFPYDIGCQPSPSIPAETLLQDSHKTYLLFFAVSNSVDETGFFKDLGVAILECKNCLISKLGYPNDEGLAEHLFFEYGLAKYPISQVNNSPWVSEISEQIDISTHRIGRTHIDRINSRENDKIKHFIITLKETTFECIASSLIIERYCENFEDAFTYAISKLRQD